MVVVGTSAGGLDALRALLGALPADFAAPMCVVQHMAPDAPALLDSILARAGRLPVSTARERLQLRPGHVYVAPPDHHLLVEPGVVLSAHGPRENRFRPAIDPLFRSAARVFGPRAIGVILTGNLDDGTAGLMTIKQLGGTAVVQDPQDAQFPSMPASALKHVTADRVLPLHAIAPALVELVTQPPARPKPRVSEGLDIELDLQRGNGRLVDMQTLGDPSVFACPDCHGVLMRVKQGSLLRFRCHTGHAYTAASLAAAIDESVETALWNAVRALEEASLLKCQLAEHAGQHDGTEPDRYVAEAGSARLQAERLRRLIGEHADTQAERG